MYGWRARVGLIVPSSNTTMEEEFRRLMPHGVSLHVARMKLVNVTVEELFEMEKHALSAASDLADANVNVIVYGCTSGSLIGGYGYDRKIAERIEGKLQIPVVTTAGAVIKALKKLGVKKVALATPYIDEVNAKEREFLEANGFKVVSVKGLGISSNLEIGKLGPEVAYKLGKEVDIPGADGVFISCTNFRTIEIIDELEKDIGKPVVTSNQATFWDVVNELKLGESVGNLGRLLTLKG